MGVANALLIIRTAPQYLQNRREDGVDCAKLRESRRRQAGFSCLTRRTSLPAPDATG
jgi:hypothetical protein